MNIKNYFLNMPSSKKRWLIISGIILAALNLRASIASVGPVITFIRNEMGISNGTAGMLTTLPLIAFAAISPLAPKLGLKMGHSRAMFFGMLLLTIGIVIRSTGILINLFLGTALLGVGIAFCNVLLPGIVKEYFPDKTGLMTGGYTLSMGLSAGIASGVSYPIATFSNWKFSLSIWAVLSFIAVLCWLFQLFNKDHSVKFVKQPSKGMIYKSPIAWKVTLFMGIQSLLFFCMVAWLPEIITSLGYSKSVGGWMLSLVQILGLPTMFLIPIIADRFKDQRGIVLFIGIIDLIGFSLLLAGGNIFFITIGIICFGAGQGAAISLSLTLITLRTANVQEASNLSGMAQSIGYLMAAIGPFLMGIIFDLYHSWTIPLTICLILTCLMVMAGLGASQNQYIFSKKLDGTTVN
ncbi:MFS transporter [Neobacillus mesonae]|uniref:CynX/NimT family MFS transporter n=1 Tax=Neobacillus mesonae TaxID=1193713 RepID=UPI00203F616B|nr:MFS transporter [Neobacillus mesonae]MCM3569572.1 MFS transporter [Neobacillus mesonae]